jgi:hypothetical protein
MSFQNDEGGEPEWLSRALWVVYFSRRGRPGIREKSTGDSEIAERTGPAKVVAFRQRARSSLDDGIRTTSEHFES